MYLYCYMYMCLITRNCNSLRNKISIYLSNSWFSWCIARKHSEQWNNNWSNKKSHK